MAFISRCQNETGGVQRNTLYGTAVRVRAYKQVNNRQKASYQGKKKKKTLRTFFLSITVKIPNYLNTFFNLLHGENFLFNQFNVNFAALLRIKCKRAF